MQTPDEKCKWCGGRGGVAFGICLNCKHQQVRVQGLRETALNPKPINKKSALVSSHDLLTRRFAAWN